MVTSDMRTDEKVFEVEAPIIQTDGWRKFYEPDMEIRQAAYLIGALVGYYNLNPIFSDRPLVQRFVTSSGEVLNGAHIGTLNNGRNELDTVLAFYQEAPVRIVNGVKTKGLIRNLPAIGVFEVGIPDREFEQYDMCSVYRLTVVYRVSLSQLVELVNEVFAKISRQLTFGDEVYRASELGLYSKFLRSRILVRGPW